MRIGILETGLVPEPVLSEFGAYPALMRHWLAPDLPEAEFVTFPVVAGELPGSPAEMDGWLITGSKHGVYDDLPWIGPLKDFIARTAAADVPQFGICFGHQIVAEALGGHARKSERGWGIGRQVYASDLGEGPEELDVMVFHQDQVVALPPGARVLGGNAHCPFGIVAYDQPVLTVQSHPEFSVPFVRRLLDIREEVTVPKQVADAARATMDRAPANARFGRWAAGFYRGA